MSLNVLLWFLHPDLFQYLQENITQSSEQNPKFLHKLLLQWFTWYKGMAFPPNCQLVKSKYSPSVDSKALIGSRSSRSPEVDSNEVLLLKFCTKVNFFSICTLLEKCFFFFPGNLTTINFTTFERQIYGTFHSNKCKVFKVERRRYYEAAFKSQWVIFFFFSKMWFLTACH